MGIPMSVVISPLVYGALLVGNDLVNLLTPTPDLFYLLAQADQNTVSPQSSEPSGPLGPALALVVPGMIAMALAWLGTRALFLRAGPQGIVRALGAREPHSGDLEEQQLTNVVAEMAIAAGVKPPRVLLLDGAAANAAAIGSSHDDATVVVSRRLLDELDRDETQAVVAHLIGAVGNGDLRVALALLSLFRTIGLIMTALGATLGPASRRTLLRLLRLAFRRPGTPVSEEEAHQVDELLSKSVEMEEGDVDQVSAKGKTTILDMIKLPFLMAYTAIWMARIAFMSFVVAPLLALVWRSRRYLADATAVQLTRNPDGLAKGLASLSGKGGIVPGGNWASPLFIIAPQGSGRSFGATGASGGGLMGDEFGVLSFDPPISRRIARLRQQGATVDLAVAPSRTHPLTLGCIVLMVVPLGVVLIGCALALAGIALAIDMLLLTPLLLVCYLILRRWLGGGAM
jgi:Zn-dependent protease with chaperone function